MNRISQAIVLFPTSGHARGVWTYGLAAGRIH